VLAGTHTENFAQAYGAIFAAQGIGRVSSAPEISAMAKRLIANPAEARTMGEAASQAAAALGGAVEKTMGAIEALLAHARA
jgi:3-deoxy-D-manno-octulosonic-acid transferase